jgi:hypothetical protein
MLRLPDGKMKYLLPLPRYPECALSSRAPHSTDGEVVAFRATVMGGSKTGTS